MNIFERLFRYRPRALNPLHALKLVEATSQTYPEELALLAKYAATARVAAEIGSFQGVSAAIIAAAMPPGGLLYCIDPWLPMNAFNPLLAIFQRHVRRKNVSHKIQVLRGSSREMADRIPAPLDFMFIDGDHSSAGIAFDWTLVKLKLKPGGYVCLHDTIVPAGEPWRRLESADYFASVIQKESGFSLIEQMHSMAVLRRS